MAKIKRIKINDEWYCSIKDVVRLMKETNDIDKAIETLVSKEAIVTKMEVDNKENQQELSDFNKKLKKGLDWSPRSEG